MRRILPLPLTLAFVSMIALSAHATVLSTGILEGPSKPYAPPRRPSMICNVLWYGQDTGGEIARLSAIGPVITHSINAADLSPANLANYQVLIVAYVGPGSIGAAQPAIEAFVNAGGALLIHQPNTFGATDYTPTGFGVNIAKTYWCTAGNDYVGHIVNGTHTITTGLSDADLSGSFDLVAGIGPSYTVLAVNASCLDPSVAAGTLGHGRVVFEDGNASPTAVMPGTDLYWMNLFAFLCTGSPVPVRSSTWGELKSIYR